MLHAIAFIVFGLIVGIIARFFMPGRQPMGTILTAVLGMVGSFVGALLANLIRGNGMSFSASDPYNWIAAIVGSMLLLFLLAKMSGPRAV